MSENSKAANSLAHIIVPSTKHMEHGERADCIETALDDLYRLAKADGCIAAAWAFELLTAMGTQPVSEWGEGWLQQMPNTKGQ